MGLEQVIGALNDRRALIADDDPRRFFHDAYLRTTETIAELLDSGMFVDPDWVEQWDEVFAGYYLDALDTHLSGGTPPGPWEMALSAGRSPRLSPLRMVLLGMNAHINWDLPQSLADVIRPEEFDIPGLLAHRQIDHRAIDEILASRVAAEDRELAAVAQPGDRGVIDRLLRPLNRRGTQIFLAESRAKVWHNAGVLARARREGTYQERLAELEARAERRIKNLVEPRRVVVDLTRNAFGVEVIEDE